MKPGFRPDLAGLLATWFGCGLSPVAPGTAGSLGALGCAYLLARWGTWPPWAFGALALVLLPVGIWAAEITAQRAGRKDPGLVVIDEVVGQWITLAGATAWNWRAWLLAFVLFRMLDVWKPAPARQLESWRGGLGIMADDVMAGLYGAVALFAAGHWNLY